ncbi:adenylate/guanylate cyclase domain-containing protein [Ruegeria sp. WL0004]|uniref:adenylate cyclase n=1 Tax=Ruegeria marisflavi TaxID=2984152 RepID=A0ABT2WNI7_9RHOB|nr:adenylate/guanylate cyclase domain-containing protein [Ruegeria sp. WL0004]MCU9836545.1 adenylate/guanylate cyclase domain-containing protein [Ruegeria sp. WL0004]
MSFDPISADLFNALAAGICLADPKSAEIRYRNDLFAHWFPGASLQAPLTQVVPGLDLDALMRLAAGDTVELTTKVKRRSLVIETQAQPVRHGDRDVLLLECRNVSGQRESEAMIDSYAEMAERRARDLEREKARVEKLLLNIMPRTVYQEYMTFGSVAPRLFDPVTVLMLDFVGFTHMSVAEDPNVTVAELNDIFTAFDRIGELHGCERIKTVGDCYIAVTGLPHPTPDHAASAVKCAAKMMRYLDRRNQSHEHQWHARIGIASGPVVGSVVGIQKYIYDVFGPAVNLAARLQVLSEPMEITMCQTVALDLPDGLVSNRKRVETIKGFGTMEIESLVSREATI